MQFLLKIQKIFKIQQFSHQSIYRNQIQNFQATQSVNNPYLIPGNSDFFQLATQSNCFIDKSLFIQDFIQGDFSAMLLNFPRRFGKSLNLSMLHYFLTLEVNEKGAPLPEDQKNFRKLFAGGEIQLENEEKMNLKPLKIAQNLQLMNKYQGKFPVIYIDLKEVQSLHYDEILNKLRVQLLGVFKSHRYLLNSPKLFKEEIEFFSKYLNKEDIMNIETAFLLASLRFLTELLTQHHGIRTFVLIDEYDSCINLLHSHDQPSDIKRKHDIIQLFRDLFSSTFKSNDKNLKKGLITGVYRIAKENMFSGINNFVEYNLLSQKYNKHYGFTQNEVDSLMNVYQIPTHYQQEIQHWYNGYQHNKKFNIYNPFSIVNCFSQYQELQQEQESGVYVPTEQFLKSYWTNSGSIQYLSNLLNNKIIHHQILDLLKHKNIEFNLVEKLTVKDMEKVQEILAASSNFNFNDSVDLILSIFFFSGYLTIVDKKYFKIPNLEVEMEFSNFLKMYYQKMYAIPYQNFEKITDSIINILDSQKENSIDASIQSLKHSLKQLIDLFPKFESLNNEKNILDNKPSVYANEMFIHSLLCISIVQIPDLQKQGYKIYYPKKNSHDEPDVIILKEENQYLAAVFEIKYNADTNTKKESEETGLKQMVKNKYHRDLILKRDVVLISIYCNYQKKVNVAYQIERKRRSPNQQSLN